MRTTDLDLDVYSEAKKISDAAKIDKDHIESILYCRTGHENKSMTVFSGNIASIVNSLVAAINEDKDGLLYDILEAALNVYDETYGEYEEDFYDLN